MKRLFINQLMCPHQESNLDYKIRNLAFYPLNYKGYNRNYTIGELYYSLSNFVNSSDKGGEIRSKSSFRYRTK